MAGPAVHAPMRDTDAFVFLEADEFKPPQPRFLVDWSQGPESVTHGKDYPDPGFNPQQIDPVGPDGHDEYPANPVIAWHNWTLRDPSQSIKVQNIGSTNITPRAPLSQQRGRQSPPIQYPNMVVQSPTDWDDELTITPTTNPAASSADKYVAMANAFTPAVVNG